MDSMIAPIKSSPRKCLCQYRTPMSAHRVLIFLFLVILVAADEDVVLTSNGIDRCLHVYWYYQLTSFKGQYVE